ncbi:hypothetical protein KEM60_00226 [Austwickia sp. TVS 96-490-7B]|uniref:DUF5926 family protein n=1 Tax=Austwickia sp. TVS 96-490-7B TaxID=2830843 RepID=UPI001C59C9CA|nr:DUF5926 family protein [Austwickia sp. TVS 96-490-7B]MBW3084043.1 hypothetical protein [Austwickia sp. TVS 96-490-7B]
MGKASRKKRQAAAAEGLHPVKVAPAPFVARPFHGLPGETDWVAMREIVPAAGAKVTLRPEAPAIAELGLSAADLPAQVTVCTVLPMAWPALRRVDGELMVALQTVQTTGDASRDVAQAMLAAIATAPGSPVTVVHAPTAQTPRLQDLLDLDADFDVTVHDDFGFWVAPEVELDAEGQASLEQANAAIVPTVKLAGVDSAYWCRIGERTHIRWILPYDEDAATDALARLHAAGDDLLGEGTRLLGAFRADGLLCPVWDLDPQAEAADYEQPMAALAARFTAALAVTEPLTVEQRRAKNGLLSRQLTLR